MKDFYYNNKAFLDKLGLLLAIAALVFIAVFLMGYIGPFVAGFVISLILNPLVGLIERKWRIHRGVVAAVLILLAIAAIFAIGGFLINRLVSEMVGLAAEIPQYFEAMGETLSNIRNNLQNTIGIAGLELDFDTLLNNLLAFATGLLQRFIEGGNFITAIPGAILRVLLAIISAFFFIKDKELIKESLASLFPEKVLERVRMVRDAILDALVGYAKGQLIIMCFVSTICIIGLTIIRSPYSLFVGIGIAVFDLIPIFGAGGILIPWMIYSFVIGNISHGIGLLVIYVLVVLTRQLLEPRVVGKQIGIHPIILLIGVYVGITTIGPIGILAGPLIIVLIKSIMEAELEIRV
jgi:sporulation integral membrane protein YtvI